MQLGVFVLPGRGQVGSGQAIVRPVKALDLVGNTVTTSQRTSLDQAKGPENLNTLDCKAGLGHLTELNYEREGGR